MASPLRRLPTMAEVNAQRRARPKAAMVPRVVEREAKKADTAKAEKSAKEKAWKAAKGRCARCDKPITRGVDSVTAAHAHHKRFRSQGGKWEAGNLEYVCGTCHAAIHGGRTR